jgi:AcrR family transcriptional regulator
MREDSHSATRDQTHEDQRRIPTQQRGEKRVAQLLEAAAFVIAARGYEGATMSAIARRARAPIGSLYQFFPNKPAITYALRTKYGNDYEALLIKLECEAARLTLEKLVARLVRLSIRFVESHPAFLALLDAPLSTRSPQALRLTLRKRLARCFSAVQPDLAKRKALRIATVTLQMVKGLSQIYAEAELEDAPRFVREYRVAITSYLTARLARSGGLE